MSLMLSGYIISTPDLVAYASQLLIPNTEQLLVALNDWLNTTQHGLPLLRRIQPQNLVLLPTRAITAMRFKFEEEDRDRAVLHAFIAACPNADVRRALESRIKFVTVPNPFNAQPHRHRPTMRPLAPIPVPGNETGLKSNAVYTQYLFPSHGHCTTTIRRAY
ncbi:hypothetical protein BDZ89DRAFT_23756 [Hymenopellis radicata]|nr:hypothetical protein BDZ89DRAFT_23756 [Hymenopellis radicata]